MVAMARSIVPAVVIQELASELDAKFAWRKPATAVSVNIMSLPATGGEGDWGGATYDKAPKARFFSEFDVWFSTSYCIHWSPHGMGQPVIGNTHWG